MTAPGPSAPGGGPAPGVGAGLVRASWWGTAAFALVAGAAVVSSGPVRTAAAALSLALFAAGVVAFAAAFAVALRRSRTEELSVAGAFLLSGSAPAPVRRALLSSLGAEVAVALATAAARPFTSLAFGVLVPVYGLGLAGLWGARHGRFGPRRSRDPRRPGTASRPAGAARPEGGARREPGAGENGTLPP